MAELNTKIIIRNDTAENFATNNPVLMKGEMGIEIIGTAPSITYKIKIGDGVTSYNDLPYAYDPTSIASGITVYEASVAYGGDKLAALEAVATSPSNGDVGIVTEAITDDYSQITGYIYNGSQWVAMDGNYDAANIYFSKDLVFTQTFGKYSPDSSGSVTIPTATDGMSLQSMLENAYSEEQNPTTTQPSCSITLTSAGSREVGTVFSPSYSVSFNAGSYTYGPATGVTVESYSVSDTDGHTATTQTGSFDSFTVGDSTNYRVSVTVTHTAGATPLTNLGNEYPAGAIAAGTKSANSSYVTGYRCMFYGTMTTKPDTMTSGDIRGLSSRQASAATLSVSVPVGAYRVVLAVPTAYQVTSVLDVNGLNAQIFSSFTQTTVQVEGANGYDAIDYNVYYLDYASANDTANTYTVTVTSA